MPHFDLVEIIKTVGYLGIFTIVFAESGLLIGFFLPGDSLLFTAGFLASQEFFNIWFLVPLIFIAAVVGDSVGYSFGYRVGPKIFTKQNSLFFQQNHLHKAKEFFQKHGGKAIILARFIPIIRTFTPILAGVGKMHYKTFLLYNIMGGVGWAVGLTTLGYFLGQTVPDIDRYLLPIIIGIIMVSLLPTLIHTIRNEHTRNQIISSLKRCLPKN